MDDFKKYEGSDIPNLSYTLATEMPGSTKEEQNSRMLEKETKMSEKEMTTIRYQHSALNTIMNSEHAKNMRPAFRTTAADYTNRTGRLIHKHANPPTRTNDSTKSKEDPTGLTSNIINLISQCVTEIPSLEEEIDREEIGTYDAATRTIDEKVKEFFKS